MRTAHLPSIPVLVEIHVEPDVREVIFGDQRWLGYENLHCYLGEQRERLAKATGKPVRFCWLIRLDPQVQEVHGRTDWPLRQYASLLQEAQAAGDELGLHVHAWRYRRYWLRKRWVADHGDASWVAECLRISHDTFCQTLGFPPRSISFGDRFMSDPLMAQMEKLGFLCDLTQEPKLPPARRNVQKEFGTGSLPDYRQVPRHPFRPSIRDFRRPGDGDARNIWEIPVSVGQSVYFAGWRTLLLGMGVEAAQEIIEQNLLLPDPYLGSVMRTDVRLDDFNRQQFDRAIDYLSEHPLRQRFDFETPAAMAARLESARVARTAAAA